jgi:hypothetical protein
MNPEFLAFAADALHWTIGSLLALALFAFLLQFLLPGLWLGSKFGQSRRRLTQLKSAGPAIDLDRIRDEVMITDTLKQAWDEYRDTLHGQKQANAQGILEVSRWRATSVAGNFFTDQALIEAPLRTEFYKHLPGILTGLGIIGTFSGLIIGLQDFGRVDLGDAEKARAGLQALLQTVGGAFVVSGAAIALAMVVTVIEKQVINLRYTQLESLRGLIDSLFDAGAGEEYLQRLVEAAETSATQAMQMKESLVTDLKQVLTELTSQQISAMATTSGQLGQVISTSLKEGLTEPLARISDAVQAVGSSQGEAVNKLLTDVLGGFTAQMENMFGNQMRGMNEMLVQTANTIRAASQRFDELAGQIQQAGSGAADAMAKRMDEALLQMQMRQSEANDQMRIFIDQLKDNIAKGQSESAELTLGMMRELGESTGALVRGLQEHAHEAQRTNSISQSERDQQIRALMDQMRANVERSHADSTEATGRLLAQIGETTGDLLNNLRSQADGANQQLSERQAELAAHTSDLLNRQTEQVSRLTDAVHQASSAMREAVDKLQQSTSSSIESMGAGAERLLSAATQLTGNLQAMKAASDGIETVAIELSVAGDTLGSALAATQQALGDQKSVRDALSAMVSDLRATVENAKRESGLTASLVDGLQVACQRLNEAQQAADTYLEGVTEVLGETHGAFAKQMEITLREGNRTFHEELAQATSLLKGAIQDLGDVLDNLPASS